MRKQRQWEQVPCQPPEIRGHGEPDGCVGRKSEQLSALDGETGGFMDFDLGI